MAHGAVLQMARTPEKPQGLAHLPLLAQAAAGLRAACRQRAQLPEDGAESVGAWGWLSRCLPAHGILTDLWTRSHIDSHSVSVPAPP